MAYATYTTEAIVCGSKVNMTSDKSYLLFTREAGMLWASARSVREERSKQRYALQDFSIIRVSLVKGKTGWRIGSVAAVSNPFMGAEGRLGRTGIAYLIKMLRRYVHGEQPMSDVFDDYLFGLEKLVNVSEHEQAIKLQQIIALRLLYLLGYVERANTVDSLLPGTTLAEALANYEAKQDKIIDSIIIKAAEISHL